MLARLLELLVRLLELLQLLSFRAELLELLRLLELPRLLAEVGVAGGRCGLLTELPELLGIAAGCHCWLLVALGLAGVAGVRALMMAKQRWILPKWAPEWANGTNLAKNGLQRAKQD